MSDNEFALGTVVPRAERLLADSQTVLERYELATEGLPATMQPSSGRLKLVFVGQYSAGKSSLIKMLTGIDTGIGAAIKTTESASYDWNGLEIIDTPGIQTGVHPDHDEITYEAINHAALLVFVITNEGFNQTLGEHFIKLVREHNRGKNIVLVVNKMDRAMKGNSHEQQAVMLPDIEKVLGECGLTPDDVYLSFVSTAEYDEAQMEDDAELVADYIEQSGIEPLVAHLNAFTAARGIAARITEPLYTLREWLYSTCKVTTMTEGDESLLQRQLDSLQRNYTQARQDIDRIVERCRREIEGLGAEAGCSIIRGASQESMQSELERCYSRADSAMQKANSAIGRCLANLAENMDYENRVLFQPQTNGALPTKTSFGQALPAAIDSASSDSSDSFRSLAEGASKAVSLSKTGLKGYNGEGILSKENVKTVAGWVGKKFKPWEAAKWTKWLNGLGLAISIGGALYSLYKEDEERAKAERDIAKARRELADYFTDAAAERTDELSVAAHEALRNIIAVPQRECEQKLADISTNREQLKARDTAIAALIARANELITACGGDMATAAE